MQLFQMVKRGQEGSFEKGDLNLYDFLVYIHIFYPLALFRAWPLSVGTGRLRGSEITRI